MIDAVDWVLPALRASRSRLHDIFDVDNGIVDDRAERDHQPGQHHRVDRRPSGVEHEDRGHERQRNRHDADQRGPPVQEEDAEDEHDEKGPEDQRRRQMMDRLLDEARRSEDGGVDLHAGQPGRISSMAFSTPLVTSRVLPHGSFSTTSMRPGPSLITASPASGGAPVATSATSPMRKRFAVLAPRGRRQPGLRA